MLGRAALVLCLALALPACRRQKGPDANFHSARELYEQLYATQLDEAYGDPRMDEVVALLGKVHPRSADAPQARAMLETIARGRETLARELAAREKLAAEAAKGVAAPPGIDMEKILAASREHDAGVPQDPYGTGAEIAALNAQSGGCMTENEPFEEQGTPVRGAIFRLAQSEDCRKRLPGFVGQAVLVVGGRIYRRIPDPAPPPQPSAPRPGATRPAASSTGPQAPSPEAARDAG